MTENTTASMEDLLLEEEEQFSTTQPVSLRTGIANSKVADRLRVEGERPNATRWLFNPFEFIDLRNEPTSCGIDYLRNVVFNKIKSIPVNVAKKDAYDLPQTGHNEEFYDQFMRTSLMVAAELTSKNGDKGVILITELIGEEDAVAGDLNALLFGDEVVCIADIDNPEFPCPVLPTLLETLDVNVRRAASAMAQAGQDSDRNLVLAVARRVRDSIVLAMRSARLRIDEAQKRMLDEKNPNRNLSINERRCYLALGLEIPNVMPFLTPKAAQQNNGGSNAVDYEAIGRGVAQGMQMAQGAGAGAGAGAVETATAPPAGFAPGVPNVPVTLETGAADPSSTDGFEVTEEELDALETDLNTQFQGDDDEGERIETEDEQPEEAPAEDREPAAEDTKPARKRRS